ncbi:bacterio-opsin activator domain-containing protein [Halohasta litchfieldiae]|uniref:bacterio-opsin activator domain-containing protein n=1 Tax=Halohasta litchfieldiae TaxID=1073996 RepID=UPI0013A55E6B|nr:bacterio-opsin activator domain-containing protein [Halohasta litchfieldiae]
MPSTEQLIKNSLDTLPIHIAILDDDGTILQTNQPWQEYGSQNNIQSDTVGANYLEICSQSSTNTGEQTGRGLSELLDGTREMFTLEYPCHSPVQQQWFLLIAVSFTVDNGRYAVVGHFDITEYKRKQHRLEQQHDQLEALNQLNTAIRTLTHDVIEQSTRAGIEQAACRALVDTDVFVCAWLGRVDPRDESVEITTKAGAYEEIIADSPLIESDAVVDTQIVKEAIRTGEIQTADNKQEHRSFGQQYGSQPTESYRSVAAVPITHEETVYSVVCLYTNRPNAFGTDEQAISTQLGAIVGHAIVATERKQALISDELIEVELQIPNFITEPGGRSADWTVTVTQTVSGSDDDCMMYGTVSEDDLEAVETAVDKRDDIRLTVVGKEQDTVRIELHLRRPSLVSQLAAHGWSTTDIVLTNGGCYLTVHLPPGDDVHRMMDVIRDRFPNVELLARRQISSPQPVDSKLQTVIESLTDRQLTVLRTAQAAGYFEWPRQTSGKEIAETLDIAPPTFHQHLRLGERKIMAAVFDEAPIAI